jgi:hypothetical protein
VYEAIVTHQGYGLDVNQLVAAHGGIPQLSKALATDFPHI